MWYIFILHLDWLGNVLWFLFPSTLDLRSHYPIIGAQSAATDLIRKSGSRPTIPPIISYGLEESKVNLFKHKWCQFSGKYCPHQVYLPRQSLYLPEKSFMAHCRTKEISSINELEEYYFKLSTEDFDVYHWMGFNLLNFLSCRSALVGSRHFVYPE